MSTRSRGQELRQVRVLVALGAVGVILILLALLFWPHIGGQPWSTSDTIEVLGVGIEQFKSDFGIYPPSDSAHDNGAMPYGRSALVYYLMGPELADRGSNGDNESPVGADHPKGRRPHYILAGTVDTGYLTVDGGPSLPVFLDGFSRPILYFRAEAGRDPLFDVRDNPLDPNGRTGFASQAQFEMLAKDKEGRWVREDYLLISAGQDRYFGPMVIDTATGTMYPAKPDDKDWSCDDVTNFKH